MRNRLQILQEDLAWQEEFVQELSKYDRQFAANFIEGIAQNDPDTIHIFEQALMTRMAQGAASGKEIANQVTGMTGRVGKFIAIPGMVGSALGAIGGALSGDREKKMKKLDASTAASSSPGSTDSSRGSSPRININVSPTMSQSTGDVNVKQGGATVSDISNTSKSAANTIAQAFARNSGKNKNTITSSYDMTLGRSSGNLVEQFNLNFSPTMSQSTGNVNVSQGGASVSGISNVSSSETGGVMSGSKKKKRPEEEPEVEQPKKEATPEKDTGGVDLYDKNRYINKPKNLNTEVGSVAFNYAKDNPQHFGAGIPINTRPGGIIGQELAPGARRRRSDTSATPTPEATPEPVKPVKPDTGETPASPNISTGPAMEKLVDTIKKLGTANATAKGSPDRTVSNIDAAVTSGGGEHMAAATSNTFMNRVRNVASTIKSGIGSRLGAVKDIMTQDTGLRGFKEMEKIHKETNRLDPNRPMTAEDEARVSGATLKPKPSMGTRPADDPLTDPEKRRVDAATLKPKPSMGTRPADDPATDREKRRVKGVSVGREGTLKAIENADKRTGIALARRSAEKISAETGKETSPETTVSSATNMGSVRDEVTAGQGGEEIGTFARAAGDIKVGFPEKDIRTSARKKKRAQEKMEANPPVLQTPKPSQAPRGYRPRSFNIGGINF